MLSAELKKSIQGSYTEFLDKRGLRARYAQKEMIAAIARQLGSILVDEKRVRLGEKHLIAVEAGTGTGKTIAYLLAALPVAQARNKTLIVSTATVALQEQLITKDLPELAEYAGRSFDYQIAKGRRRYLCVTRLESVLDQQADVSQMALYEDEAALKLGPTEIKLYKGLMDEYASGRWNGDRDELSVELDEQSWLPLTSDHHQCTNRRCLNFSVCPFFKARAAIERADLIVVNHDLVLADLSLGGGAILPEPEDSIYLFDEAHNLGAKATQHFALSMRLGGSERAIKTLEKNLTQLVEESEKALVINEIVSRLHTPLRDVQLMIARWKATLDDDFLELPDSERRKRFARGEVPENHRLHAHQLATILAQADPILDRLLSVLRDALEGEQSELDRSLAERWLPVMGVHWGRMQRMLWLCRSYAEHTSPDVTPTARWIVKHDSDTGQDIELHSAPVSAHTHLHDLLWSQCFAAVLTSATLTALGRFDTLFTQLGVPLDTPAIRLASPFNYGENAQLVVPSLRTDPGRADEHTEEIAEWIDKELIKIDAGLILFTSWRQMKRVLELLSAESLTRVLAQGDRSKQAMLTEHRARIDRNEPSSLFGLASFAEGVDLPGKYLKDVIITKLPFSVPDDPVDATLAEWVEQRGGNAFQEISVPAASIKLTQAVGRLLRTEEDSGRVVLLDRRVVTRRYGQALLDALPPFQRIIEP